MNNHSTQRWLGLLLTMALLPMLGLPSLLMLKHDALAVGDLPAAEGHRWQSAHCDDLAEPRLLSRASGVSGVLGDAASAGQAISSDGRWVAFRSEASNLVPNDTNTAADIFVRDLQSCTTTRVSVATDGAQANASSAHPSLSGDGRYVVFESKASNLVSNDTNLLNDVFLHDRQTGQTTLISQSTAPPMTSGDRDSHQPVISADGEWIAFSTRATNLGSTGNTLNYAVVLVRRSTGALTALTQAAGVVFQQEAGAPAISGDGRYVVFAATSLNAATDTTAHTDIYLIDRQSSTTTRVSLGAGGVQPNGLSTDPAISADGRFVVYASTADNLAGGDSAGCAPYPSCTDIFLYDVQAGTTTLVSRPFSAVETDGHARNPVISGDGRFVVFDSASTQMVAGDSEYCARVDEPPAVTNTPAPPLTFCVDCQGGAAAGRNASLSCPDLFLFDTQNNSLRLLSQRGGSYPNERSLNAAISLDGRVVAFDTYASDLTTDDTNQQRDVLALTNPLAPALPVLQAPSGLTAAAVSSSSITLNWLDNSADESAFYVERSPNGTDGWAVVSTVSPNTTSTLDSGLICRTTYHYRVRAFRGADASYSAYSNVAGVGTWTCPLIAPTDLTATAVSTTQINLAWVDGASDETAYRVDRSVDGIVWATVVDLPANTTTYPNPGLTCATTYQYRVRAYRASDMTYSDQSNIALATTAACAGDSLAVFNPTTHTANLMVGLQSAASQVFTTGFPYGPGGQYVMGDWNGDGTDTMGVYFGGAFFYTNDTHQSSSWTGIWFGLGGQPVAGRFDANVSHDCIGVTDSGTWTTGDTYFALYFACDLTSGPTPPLTFQWLSIVLPTSGGFSGTHQFGAGDFNGDGVDSIAIRRGPFIAWTNVAPTTLLSAFNLAQYIGAPGSGDEGQVSLPPSSRRTTSGAYRTAKRRPFGQKRRA